jgi:transposase
MEFRRQRGLSMLAEGKSPSEIAREIGVTPQAGSKWAAAYRSGGNKAPVNKGKPGRKTWLTSAETQSAEAALRKGPVKNGYRNDLWITALYRGSYCQGDGSPSAAHNQQLSLLRGMGWSYQGAG